MEKNTLEEVINDLRGRRDCLSIAYTNLKKESDQYNKCIISLSLITGSIESTKIQMGWENPYVALIPIFMSSIVGVISAMIKFKQFPEKMETLIQSQGILTATLNKARNSTELNKPLLEEYNNALEKLEVSLPPDIRRKYLKQSHKNLLCILKQEQEYFNNIRKVNAGEQINIKCGSSDDISIKHVNSYSELELNKRLETVKEDEGLMVGGRFHDDELQNNSVISIDSQVKTSIPNDDSEKL